MNKPSKQRSLLRLHVLLISFVLLYMDTWLGVQSATQGLLKGFTATPNPSISSFQALLNDSAGDFSLGFFRFDRSQLALSIIHVPSAELVWQANTTSSTHWSKSTRLFFNGSLVLSDSKTGVLWSTRTNGDRLLLLNNSNLQIQKNFNDSSSVLWQSFDFPSDTLMENQNFTVQMTLTSSNGVYSMKMGYNFIGLYAEFKQGSDQIYWKHSALEAKSQIIPGEGPIYARISSNGFLGMYQTDQVPVDVQAFESFQINVPGIRRLRLESDGNLRGYYWNGSKWVSDFQAISNECELPSKCGSYGLCKEGDGCSCLDDRKKYQSGECFPPESGDFCSDGEENEKGFWVLERRGVELPYKELMGFVKMGSSEECENSCEKNCSCWGSVYNNASGFCYRVDYPIDTLVSVQDETKIGYFKVRRSAEKKRIAGFEAEIGLLIGTAMIFLGALGFVTYNIWRRKREFNGVMEDGMSSGPFKDLSSASFRSLELCKR